jgi:hypothetical protein
MAELPTGEGDQFDATVRDLVAANGLEVIQRAGIDAEWCANHTGTEVMAALLTTAIAATEAGHLYAIAAVPSQVGISVQFLIVGRGSDEPPPDVRGEE